MGSALIAFDGAWPRGKGRILRRIQLEADELLEQGRVLLCDEHVVRGNDVGENELRRIDGEGWIGS